MRKIQMNERIKELADLCTTKTRFSYEGTAGGYNTEHFNKEKFAELIVKDCATIDFYKRTGISLKDDYRVTQVILEHFGVKE